MKTLSQKDVFVFRCYFQFNYWNIAGGIIDRLEYRGGNRLVIKDWPANWSKELILEIYKNYKEIYDDFLRRNGIEIIKSENDYDLELI